MQNNISVDVFFRWGIMEQEGQNKLALVAGGWNEPLILDDGPEPSEYLKLMTSYTMLLAQAEVLDFK